ncbi:DUF4265 domain-containing protein [Kitasatospora sp. NPDC093558]|uniref:DUF4265 domain-containing protein n=1 Tax=Kitasatospora sp. NPDC093558 TaxID=3155201 RepID=UPI003413F15F
MSSTPGTGLTHIRLLAGYATAGRPVYEVLPARTRADGAVELAGSPGLVLGCAAGDRLTVGDDGTFEVVSVGPNRCLQAGRRQGGFAPEDVAALAGAMRELDGLVEAPADGRFVVVTVARSAGGAAVERVMDGWAARVDGAEWWIGNE